MASMLTDEQKEEKRRQEDMRRRQSVTNFPAPQDGMVTPMSPIATVPESVQTAQQKATTGFTSPLQEQHTQNVATLMKPPSQEESQKRIASTMGQFKQQRAKSLDEFARQTGGRSGAGVVTKEMLDRIVMGGDEGVRLKHQLEQEEADRSRQHLIESVRIGGEAIGQQERTFRGDIDSMLQAGQGVLGFADLASRERMFLGEQDFQKTMAAFQQEHEKQLQAGNIEAAQETQLRQQKFEREQTQIAQEFSKFVLFEEQDFHKQMAYLKNDFQTAFQNKDIGAAREALRTQLDFEKNQAKLGREFTSEQNSLNRILEENLANLGIDSQKEFIELKGKVDEGLLLTEQDFRATESALKRDFDAAESDKNIGAQFGLQAAQNEFTKMQEESKRKWMSAEREATEAFSSTERIDQNKFAQTMQVLEFNQEAAMSDKNFVQAKEIESMKGALALKLQTQDMNHSQKMAWLDVEIQAAKGKQNVQEQIQLMAYKTGQEMALMEKQGKINEQHMYLENQLTTALQNNDYIHSLNLQKNKFEHNMKIHLDDMVLKNKMFELEKAGFDKAAANDEIQLIMQAVQNGQASTDDVYEAMKKHLSPEMAAILSPPDPMALQMAIAEQYQAMQLQYSMTHPGSAELHADGSFKGLKPESMKDFNDFMNTTTYDEPDTGLKKQAEMAVEKLKQVKNKTKTKTSAQEQKNR